MTSDRKYFTTLHEVIDLPILLEMQLDSFELFKREGLRELFDEISPIKDFSERDLELNFLDYYFDEPTSWLDVRQRLNDVKVVRKLAESGKSVMVIEHDLATLDAISDYSHILYG